MPLEHSIEQDVIDWATAHDIPHFKLKLDTNAGWPDNEFLLPGGKPAFIEFKKPGKKPRKLQAYRILTLTRLGYDVLWTDSKETAIRWLVEICASRVPETGNQADDWAGVRGLIPRPRSRED